MKTRLCLLVALFLGAVPATAQRYVRSFPTIDALLASTPADVSTNAWVAGRNAPGDGGEGPLYYDKASVTSTNLGTIHKPNNASGRWKRPIRNSTVNVRWFGAKGDASTDDTVAVQDCLNWRDPIFARPGTYVFPTGWYRISSVTATGGLIIGEGHVERGADVVPNSSVIIEQTLGATNDLFVFGDSHGNSLTARNFLLLGHPEYNLRNPVTITTVVATNRQVFQVSSVPSIEGAKGGPPYLGFGAIFTDENRYLGSFMLKQFTNFTGVTTNWVQIADGTDAYATVAGETVLRTGFKVCFPRSREWFVGTTSFGQRAFSSEAGYSAIRLENTDQCNLEDIKMVNWHTGIACNSSGYTIRNIETYNCHLSGMIAEPFGFLADNTSYGFLLFNGKYQLDDALVPNSYTLDNTLFRSSCIGFGAVGAQAKHEQIVAGPSALYGLFNYGGINSHFDNLLIESPVLFPLYSPVGNSGSPQTATTINRLRVLGGYANDPIPSTRPSTLPIIEIGTDGAGYSIGQLTVGQFTRSGYATNWTWGYLYKWPSYATNTGLIAIGNLVDPNRMVAAHNPGGTTYQQAWNLVGGTTVTGGTATAPIMTWQRDVAEPNPNKIGLTYSAGAKFLFAHDGDGVVNDVGYTLESTSTATQITLGNNSGAASPRSAIIQGEPATGTDVSGGNAFIRPGAGRGAAITGSTIHFQTPDPTTAGSTAQSHSTKLQVAQGGQLVFTGMSTNPTIGTVTGSIYYNNSSNVIRFNNGAGWKPLKTGVVIRIATNLNFPSTSAQTESDTVVSVPGAVLGDVVNLGVPNASIVAGSFFNAWVSATDTVTVRFNNYSSTSKDPALGTFTIDVEQ